ncbi:hypothetical protein [Rhizosphaericola mali]|uniref:Uncharacterized protein n=1 Tax=Rhizosphaericola mali TaxID=2545455 RepID=A0A5P2G5R4_9BACT|nr:hypothetical protein [Rhizosphaericola mali]QES90577.1 hypothetical protein E0W69_018585 [Rhizosphaericola mali]
MNYTILILWVALIILCLLWLNISKKLKTDFIDSINYEDEKKNAPVYIEDLLNNKLLYVKSWMHDKSIDSIAVASISKDWQRSMKEYLLTTINNQESKMHSNEVASECIFVISDDQLYAFVPKLNSSKIYIYKLEKNLLANAKLSIKNSYFKLSNYLNSTLSILANQTNNYIKFNLPFTNSSILYYIKNKKREYDDSIKNIIINYNFLQSLEHKYPNINPQNTIEENIQNKSIAS